MRVHSVVVVCALTAWGGQEPKGPAVSQFRSVSHKRAIDSETSHRIGSNDASAAAASMCGMASGLLRMASKSSLEPSKW